MARWGLFDAYPPKFHQALISDLIPTTQLSIPVAVITLAINFNIQSSFLVKNRKV